MKVDIISCAKNIEKAKIMNKNVVVIDMLRATSVIITALENGCKEVIPVIDVDEARDIVKDKRDKYILGGERNAIKIEGFDFSNSPLEYTRKNVQDKILVMTTSNGTRAIKGSEGAKHVFISALINGNFTANKLIEENEDVTFINAGTNDEFSLDDFICSGYIIECLLKHSKQDIELSDIALTANYIYKNNTDIFEFIKVAKHYKTMQELGLIEDVKYCCNKDIINAIAEYKEGRIIYSN